MSNFLFGNPPTADGWTRTRDNVSHIDDYANAAAADIVSPGGVRRPNIAKQVRDGQAKLELDAVPILSRAIDAADSASGSANRSEAAAASSGDYAYFKSYAAFQAAINDVQKPLVEIGFDETKGHARTRYARENGAWEFQFVLPIVEAESLHQALQLPAIGGYTANLASFWPGANIGGGPLYYDPDFRCANADFLHAYDPNRLGRWTGEKDAAALKSAIDAHQIGLGAIPSTNRIGGKIRFVRDWVSGSNQSSSNLWVEIKAFSNGENVALGKTVTSDTDTSDLAVVTDGDLDTSKYAKSSGGRHNVVVDLGDLYDIDIVQIYHYYGDPRLFAQSLTEVSADGQTWTTLYDSAASGQYVEAREGRKYDLTHRTGCFRRRGYEGSAFTVPEWAGALSDGVFDNTPAFVACGDFAKYNNAIALYFGGDAAGFYRYAQWIGPLRPDSQFGCDPIFDFSGVDTVVVHGNGCRARLADGTRFGGFDSDGNPADQVGASGGGEFFYCVDNESVSMRGFRWDGNAITHVIGGQILDTGWQVREYGCQIRGKQKSIRIDDFEFFNSGVDGLSFWYESADDGEEPQATVSNTKILYCGRQASSISGAKNLIWIGCTLAYTGLNPDKSAAAYAMLPGALVDFEAQKQPVDGVHFIGCTLVARAYNALTTVGAETNLKFTDCDVVAEAGRVLYNGGGGNGKEPNIVFRGCRVLGPIVRVGNALFVDCDMGTYGMGRWAISEVKDYVFSNVGLRGLWRNCRFWHNSANSALFSGGTALDCEFHLMMNASDTDNQAYGDRLLGQVNASGLVFDETTGSGKLGLLQYGAPPPGTLGLRYSGAVKNLTPVYSTYPGGVIQAASNPIFTGVTLTCNQSVSPASYDGASRLTVDRHAANSGVTRNQGDITFNATPSETGVLCNVCTTAGVEGSTAVMTPGYIYKGAN